MDRPTAQLPPPGSAALASSRALAARIRTEIAAAGGWIGFDRYMQLALYEPGLGYYSAGSVKLGAAGDFVTAPELGSTLARALARELEPTLAALRDPVLLELGAGRGTLAAQLLELLGAGAGYRILEPSADLRARQQAALAAWGGRVSWLDGLPDAPFEGVVIANEVVDALPAARFVKRGGRVRPLGVAARREAGRDRFEWAEGPDDPALEGAVAGIERALGAALPDGYCSEVRLLLPAWLAALGDALARGCVWLIDYGLGQRDYYRRERSTGTLVCHYRHRILDDPFLLPGLEDISVWVDFGATAEAALAAGFDVAGYTTQGQFLLEALGPELAAGPALTARAASELKTLVLPGEMGERFKVMLLAKGVEPPPLPGRDLRDRLL